MATNPIQKAALKQFSSQSFFVLTGLEKGSEFGINGKVWQVNKFSGVKFLPPGLHFFIFSSVPASTTNASASSSNPTSGIGIRHGLFRVFHSDRSPETIAEEWDNTEEQLGSNSAQSSKKRRRTTKCAESSSSGTIISQDYLKSIDAELAPYDPSIEKTWSPLVDHITESTLARVIGLDELGCAKVDVTTPSNHDEKEIKDAKESGMRQWGKQRDVEVDDLPSQKVGNNLEDDDDDKLLFLDFDLKRSWPEGAVGEALSRYSRDKSWALSNAVEKQLNGDFQPVLAELQLSFVLFTLLHNFSSLPFYTSLISLICQSSSIFTPTDLHIIQSLPMLASFLSILRTQLLSLDTDFFQEHLPSLAKTLISSLETLRVNLSDVSTQWTRSPPPSGFIVWRQVVTRWDALTASLMERYGWEFAAIRGGKIGAQGVVAETIGRVPRGMENAQVWEDEEDEEGEDAPVVVELDEYDQY